MKWERKNYCYYDADQQLAVFFDNKGECHGYGVFINKYKYILILLLTLEIATWYKPYLKPHNVAFLLHQVNEVSRMNETFTN